MKTVEELLGSKIKLKGNVKKIIYPRTSKVQSGEFAIFIFDCVLLEGEIPDDYFDRHEDGKYLITLKGAVPNIAEGFCDYVVTAILENNAKYGPQYKIEEMHSDVSLKTTEDQKKFFSYCLSESVSDKVFSECPDLIDVLKRGDRKRLLSIKGVGEKTVDKIFIQYEETKDKAGAYTFFYDLEISKNMADKIIEKYKSSDIAVEKIKRNPYILIKEIRGVGWNKADGIALKSGYGPTSEARINAYFYYYFEDQANTNGHTWVDLQTLVDNIRIIAPGIKDEQIREYLNHAIQNGELYYEKETRRISLMEYRSLEERIADELLRIKNGRKRKLEHIDEIIEYCAKETGYDYTDDQRLAIKMCLNNNVSLVTGLAGCGKSSIMLPITKICHKNYLSIAQCALSGKAALNLTEITDVRGQTIHKLLGWRPKKGFSFNKNSPLPYEVIILDELSMVGGEIFLSLLEAIPDGAKLILIGDPGQLESIGLCNLIKDIENSGVIPSHHLSKIFRQAAKSGIISDSVAIYNQNQVIEADYVGTTVRGELQDLEIISKDTPRDCAIAALEKFKYWYLNQHKDLGEIIVAVAKRSIGEVSARVMNEYIQKIVWNGKKPTSGLAVRYKDGNLAYEVTYYKGDRIIVTQNCYDTIDKESGIRTR